MAGYLCVYHDGEADGVHIHQTLGVPGVVSVCDDCQPVYLITTLAGVLSVPAGELYDVVRSYQIATQQESGQPASGGEGGEPPAPAGPHPAAVIGDSGVSVWDWCACDAAGPHDQDGAQLEPGLLGSLREETCGGCGASIRGTASTMTAVISDHESCSEHPDTLSQQEAAQ